MTENLGPDSSETPVVDEEYLRQRSAAMEDHPAGKRYRESPH